MTQVPSLSQSSSPAAELEIAGVRSQLPASEVVGSARPLGRPLRQQLLLAVLPLALVPLALESLVTYLLAQNRAGQEAGLALQGQALVASEAISQSLDRQIQFAQVFGQNPLLLEKMRQGSKVAASDKLSQVAPEELETRFILDKQLQPDTALNRYMTRAAEAEGLAEIIVTEANGFNIGYSHFPTDFSQSNDSWWQQAKQNTVSVSEPTYDESTFRVGFNLAQAVRDPDSGKFLGVIKLFVTALQFDEINEYLANAGIRGTQQVQLLDTSANYVLASFGSQGEQAALTPRSLELTGGTVVKDLATRLIAAKTAPERPSDQALTQELQAALRLSDLEVSSIKTASGQTFLVASFSADGKRYAVSTVTQLDWVAIASMDQAEIRAAGRESLSVFALLVLALGTAAAVLVVQLARQLSAPLDNLSLTAKQVSGGNLNVMAEPRGSSEAQALATTFNELVTRIRGFLREQALNTRRANLAADITGTEITSAEELLPIYSRIVDETRDILQADRVVIYRFKPDWSGSVVAESLADGLPSAYAQHLSDACIPEATLQKYRTDGMLNEADVAAANLHPEHLELLRNLRVRAIVSVPVISQGRLYGLLIAHHCRTTHAWKPSEVEFLKQIGLQSGLVIERIALLEQTRALADEQRQIKEGLQRNALQLLMDVDPVSQGNLTVRAKVTEDEIGTVADSYNATIASLRKIVLQVQQAARQVSETTDQSQSAVRSLSDSAALQAEEILTALARVEEMAGSVQLVAANAERAEAAVQQAAQTVEAGDEAMNRTVEGFLAIRETVAETTKKVKRLGESSQKISNVVNLISGFAAQTNMLALNASIEASRAGEGGKGFAVVAEEVRELARQSAEATTEIEKLVASIQSETNAVVSAMEAGTEQVVAGTQLVDETRQNLTQITQVSRQISELVESIAQATVIQAQASENVTGVINTVAAIATENSTSASQVSGSFEQLRTVAQALESEVSRFTLG